MVVRGKFAYGFDFKNTDLYRVGKGEQGVLLTEPSESELLPGVSRIRRYPVSPPGRPFAGSSRRRESYGQQVDPGGLEPPASAMRRRRSPN